MKKYLVSILFACFFLTASQLHAQQADSAAMAKSQDRIESNLKDVNKIQGKIDKSQRRIEKQQKRIKRQERKSAKQQKKKEKRMNRVEKEQKKLNDAATGNQ